MGGGHKKPRQKIQPAPLAKIPGEDRTLGLGRNGPPAWRFGRLDFEGPFGWRGFKPAAALERVKSRLAAFETMRWDEIEGQTGSHAVPLDSLAKAAKDRLLQLAMDDLDELFSLRVTGKERIWGVLERPILYILWWDPEHEVCPSPKRHT